MTRFPEVDIRVSKPVGTKGTVHVHIGLKEREGDSMDLGRYSLSLDPPCNAEPVALYQQALQKV